LTESGRGPIRCLKGREKKKIAPSYGREWRTASELEGVWTSRVFGNEEVFARAE